MRRLQHSIVKAGTARIEKLLAAGKTVKILTVGKKGREQLTPGSLGTWFVSTVDMSDVKRVGYVNAQEIAQDFLRVSMRRVRRCDDVLQPLPIVVTQDPDRTQIIPAAVPRVRRQQPSMTMSPMRAKFWPTCCRAAWRRSCSRRCWRTARPSKVRGCRDGQRNPQRGRDDRQADHRLQPRRQAVITNELIEIISGAEAL